MKTKNSLLCVAVMVLLLDIIMPAYGLDSHVGFEKRAYDFTSYDDINTFWIAGDSTLLLDFCICNDGKLYCLLYALEHDCAFWICAADIYYIYCGTDNDNIYNTADGTQSISQDGNYLYDQKVQLFNPFTLQ